MKRTNFLAFAIAVVSILIHVFEELKSKFRAEFFVFKNTELALAGVAQCMEHRPVNRKVAGSIPSQGTCLGCEPGPQLGA